MVGPPYQALSALFCHKPDVVFAGPFFGIAAGGSIESEIFVAVQEGFYTLIVSKDINYPGCRYWQVTEARSGILVARDFETRRAALEALPHLVRQYGGKIAANGYYQEGNINESLYPIYKTLRAKNI